MKTAVLVWAVFATCLATSAQCSAPRFRMGQDYGASAFLSLSPHDFTLRKLTCLARAIRDRRKLGTKMLYLAFFSSQEAARYFQPPGSPRYSALYSQQLHAIYTFNHDEGRETLDILPTGFDSNDSLNTTIDLSRQDKPECKLGLSSRCLMAVVQPVVYPQEVLTKGALGRVLLTGEIGPDGRIRSVKVSEVNVDPAAAKGILADAALHNFASWQFDESPTASAIRISYNYVLESLSPAGTSTNVDWHLPSEIVVRGNRSP
jgi:hypothetical protein